MISIIVAMARNGAIGKDNSLLCHLAEDLKYFKKITKGKTVVMGRKTWESLPVKPLKFRRNIVVTSQKDYEAEGAEICNNTEELIKTLKNSDAVNLAQFGHTASLFETPNRKGEEEYDK